jgi:FKBP-type peptidyl-prolyl cis-trans isomerase
MPSRYMLACSLLAAGAIAGCGSANNSDTAHIQLPPSVNQTLSFTATATSTTTTPAATTPAIITPKTGPLSKAPTITAPKGAAPKTLVKTDLITGTGAAAAAGDTITVNYVLELYSGKLVQSSFSAQPFSTVLTSGAGGVIPGWVQGLAGMRVGGRRELIIPPALAYKNQANGTIPANSTLIFVIDLLGLTPASGAAAPTGATVATGATGASGATG